MNKGRCFICFTVSSQLVNILNTHLLAIYEKLTDLKVSSESHYLCVICHRRLQQCYKLQQLAIKEKHVSFCEDSYKSQNTEPLKPLVTLSIAKLFQVTIPCKSDKLVEKKTTNVKQEVADEATCVLKLQLEEDKLEYIQKQHIKIENESSDDLDLQSVNENDTKLLQHSQRVDIKLEELYTYNDLDNNTLMNNQTKYTSDIWPYESNSGRNLNKDHFIHKECKNKPFYENKISECVNKTKSVVCDICKKTLSSKHILMVHMRTHTGDRPFRCDICDKGFCQKSHLIVHKRLHTIMKKFRCNICNKSFSKNGDLITHKRSHSGNRPYVCDICNKAFTQCGNLKRHKILHTGERPYACDVCNKTFRQSSTLVTHKRTHTGEKPYYCDICRKRYATSSTLAKHKRLHRVSKQFTKNLVKDKS